MHSVVWRHEGLDLEYVSLDTAVVTGNPHTAEQQMVMMMIMIMITMSDNMVRYSVDNLITVKLWCVTQSQITCLFLWLVLRKVVSNSAALIEANKTLKVLSTLRPSDYWSDYCDWSLIAPFLYYNELWQKPMRRWCLKKNCGKR